jgi:Stress responsive A/B Barrel Domain
VIRVTSFVHLEPAALAEVAVAIEAVRERVDVLALEAHPTKPVARGAGQLMVLAAFADVDAYEAAISHPYVIGVLHPLLEQRGSHVEVVRYSPGPRDLRAPDLTHGIQRTLLFHIDEHADAAEVARFERTLAAMPRYIHAIRNSALSRVDAVRGCTGKPWTHVWEQEFASLDGLTDDYMNHPYHWSWVDTSFDPQAPNHLVDTELIHAMCDLDRSLLALDA